MQLATRKQPTPTCFCPNRARARHERELAHRLNNPNLMRLNMRMCSVCGCLRWCWACCSGKGQQLQRRQNQSQ
eukprot:11821900-Alexandrium_andersonii.AAC.1